MKLLNWKKDNESNFTIILNDTWVKKCLKCNKEQHIINEYECYSFYIKFTCGVNTNEEIIINFVTLL